VIRIFTRPPYREFLFEWTKDFPAQRGNDLQRRDTRYLSWRCRWGRDWDRCGHVRHTARLLKDRQVSSPSARACSHINALYDRSVHPLAEYSAACRPGLFHCCNQPVLLYAPEAFLPGGHIPTAGK